mgnify:CR=1 FL=1
MRAPVGEGEDEEGEDECIKAAKRAVGRIPEGNTESVAKKDPYGGHVGEQGHEGESAGAHEEQEVDKQNVMAEGRSAAG